MADDAYEFLGPDLLAPPPPPPSQNPAGAPINPETPQQTPLANNELAPVSAAEKFQVQPAQKDSRSGSRSRDSTHGKGKNTKRSAGKSREPSEPLPSLSQFKWLMVLSAVLIFASVAITLMVLVDGLVK